jgi:hypothetical protein
VAEKLKDIVMEEIKTINPFTLPPWEKRLPTITNKAVIRHPDSNWAAQIAVSSSAQNSVVGLSRAIETRKHVGDVPTVETFSSTLGPRTEQNPYMGKLVAIAYALKQLPQHHASDKKQSSSAHAQESTTTVWPGTCLQHLQVH